MRWSRPNTKRLRWHRAIRTGVSAATHRVCAFTGPGPPSRPRAMASLKAQRLLPIVTSKSIKPIKYQINQISQIRYDVNGTKFSYCTAASSLHSDYDRGGQKGPFWDLSQHIFRSMHSIDARRPPTTSAAWAAKWSGLFRLRRDRDCPGRFEERPGGPMSAAWYRDV